jgi:PleD family two-component response regulator
MDPVNILVASATYLAAEVARKPQDDAASKLWATVKAALGKVLGREVRPTDISAATIRKASEEVPAVDGVLQAARTRSSGLRRAARVGHALHGARILWVDDRPETNAWERELFRSLGVVVVSVETTESALASFEKESFDLLLSDIHRDCEAMDGIEGATQIHAVRPHIPIVFYVWDLTSHHIPEPAVGITNEPNELLHLVLDRLERARS